MLLMDKKCPIRIVVRYKNGVVSQERSMLAPFKAIQIHRLTTQMNVSVGKGVVWPVSAHISLQAAEEQVSLRCRLSPFPDLGLP
jgi:hypothetical protein